MPNGINELERVKNYLRISEDHLYKYVRSLEMAASTGYHFVLAVTFNHPAACSELAETTQHEPVDIDIPGD